MFIYYVEALKQSFLFYLKPLGNFEFTFFNPLFWIFLLLLFTILLQRWEVKKAFYFCLLVVFILLCSTAIESRLITFFSTPGQSLDTSLLRMISAFLVICVFLLYMFLP
jgi:hypothetical protein